MFTTICKYELDLINCSDKSFIDIILFYIFYCNQLFRMPHYSVFFLATNNLRKVLSISVNTIYLNIMLLKIFDSV